MNEHIYIDRGTPVVSMIAETLSDGSKGYGIQFHEKLVDCRDEKRARAVMLCIAEALRNATPTGEVLHL